MAISDKLLLLPTIPTYLMSTFEQQFARIQANIERKKQQQLMENQPDHELLKNSVTKSNALCRAYYRFGLVEKRCMEALISKLHPQKTNIDLQHITLGAKEYGEAFDVHEKTAYRDIASAVDILMHRVIWADRPGGKPGKIQYTLMSSAEYKDDEGQIECVFNPQIVPHLVGLKQQFAKYPLGKAVSFTSSYTWRLYELLVSWSEDPADTDGLLMGWLTVEVDELRRMLGIPESYKWSDVQRQVLDTVQHELLDKSNIELQITRKKTGRRISHLKLEFMEIKRLSPLE